MISSGIIGAILATPEPRTILVTSTDDSGPGTLRQALADAKDGDTIMFAVNDSFFSITEAPNELTFETVSGVRAYLSLPEGAHRPTVGTGVIVCTYGAGIQSADCIDSEVGWVATNYNTPILIEKKNGDEWETVINGATGGMYRTNAHYPEGQILRVFDGEKFIEIENTIEATGDPTFHWPSNDGQDDDETF